MNVRRKRQPQQTAFLKALPTPVKSSEMLDIDEAAVLLRVSKKTVYARVKDKCHSLRQTRPQAALPQAQPGAVDRRRRRPGGVGQRRTDDVRRAYRHAQQRPGLRGQVHSSAGPTGGHVRYPARGPSA